MKATVVTEIGKLEVLDIPRPEIGPYDVLCKIVYGATCAGTDIHLMDGLHPNPVSFPTILGHESIGRVVEVGSKVKHFHIGDLVSRVGCPANPEIGLGSNWGGFAEYGVAKDHWEMRKDGVPVSEWNRNRVNQILHPSISEKTAPMIITWRETLSYVHRVGVKPGDRVIVIGSGANALSVTNHAVNLGADVLSIGSLRNKPLFAYLDLLGYIDYKSDHLTEEITDTCGGKPFTMILDLVGSSSTMNQLLPLLAPDGLVGVYGWNDRKNYGINPFCSVNSFRIYNNRYDEEESHGEAQKWILSGKLDASHWYDMEHPTPLDQITSAYESLRNHERLKYLIRI